MKNEQFNEIVKSTFNRLAELSSTKGHEYSGDYDRLLNFKRNGAALALPATTIWAVYAAKHWDAVMQNIQDRQVGKERQLSEPIEGRIDDLLLYLLLLKGLLVDAEEKPQST